jgi:hypothetical protein
MLSDQLEKILSVMNRKEFGRNPWPNIRYCCAEIVECNQNSIQGSIPSATRFYETASSEVLGSIPGATRFSEK